MIFPEFQEALQVWRQTTSGYADPVWVRQTDIAGRLEPVGASESFLQNQAFADVSTLCLSDLAYENMVLPKDGIVDPRGVHWEVVGWPEAWRSINPHLVSKLKRSQWAITS